MIRMIATTTSSSIREKPACFLLMSVPQLSLLMKSTWSAYLYRQSDGQLRGSAFMSASSQSALQSLFLSLTQDRRAKKRARESTPVLVFLDSTLGPGP